MEQPRLLVKALVSDTAMQRLYELRQMLRGEDGVRTRLAVAVCSTLLLIAITLLLSTSWMPYDLHSYVNSRPGTMFVEEGAQEWQVSALDFNACDLANACYDRLSQQSLQVQTLESLGQVVNETATTGALLLRVAIERGAFENFIKEKIAVVSLPRFNYHRATLHLNGNVVGTFFSNDRIFAALEMSELPQQSKVNLDLLMEVKASEKPLLEIRSQENLLLATRAEFERYRDYIGAKNSNAAGNMGHLAKIVLAIFCLLLFLIVDSSPESYGLALFMGFEAVAMGVGMGWLPLGYFGIGPMPVLINFCYQMGDLLKLYFLFQMARIGSTSATPWLAIGALVSLPYGFFMAHASSLSITWASKLPLTRDSIVGSVGAILCMRAFWILRHQSLPWRKAALATAAAAAMFEVINSWIAHSTWIGVNPTVRTTFTVLQANCGYLFALSTFFNISTLENRVKALTKAQARAEEIERELAIGQIVQQALLRPPTLPDSVDLACHHEAALYVSGDTYYAHWDAERGVFAFLVNDVTGHGVQAALKASACNVLARTIWEGEQQAAQLRPGDGSRLAEYDRVTAKLLVEMHAIPDFNSLIGAEFQPESGELAVYRSNFTFPILIEPALPTADANPELLSTEEPVLGEFWQTDMLISRNREVIRRQLRRGSFLLFLSDGFMESSREAKQFTAYLRRQLAQKDMSLRCASLTDIVLRYEGFQERKVVDDRTLLIFQWTHPQRASAPGDMHVWVGRTRTGTTG